MALNVSHAIFDMAARGGPTSLRERVQSYVVDIQRRFERGNHDADSLNYIQNLLHSQLRTSCASNFRRTEYFRYTGN